MALEDTQDQTSPFIDATELIDKYSDCFIFTNYGDISIFLQKQDLLVISPSDKLPEQRIMFIRDEKGSTRLLILSIDTDIDPRYIWDNELILGNVLLKKILNHYDENQTNTSLSCKYDYQDHGLPINIHSVTTDEDDTLSSIQATLGNQLLELNSNPIVDINSLILRYTQRGEVFTSNDGTTIFVLDRVTTDATERFFFATDKGIFVITVKDSEQASTLWNTYYRNIQKFIENLSSVISSLGDDFDSSVLKISNLSVNLRLYRFDNDTKRKIGTSLLEN